MIKKVVIAIAAIIGVAAYLTVQEEGIDEAFGGALAPVTSVRDANPNEPLAGLVTGGSIPAVAQTNYKQMIDRVRSKTNAAMDRSVERSSR